MQEVEDGRSERHGYFYWWCQVGRRLAFNEPGSSLTFWTKVKKLARETIKANSRFFDGDVTKVSKKALTVISAEKV